MVCGTEDGRVRLFNTSLRELLWCNKHFDSVFSLQLAGATLASAGYDCVVRLWDLETAKETHSLIGHRSGVAYVFAFLSGDNHMFQHCQRAARSARKRGTRSDCSTMGLTSM